MQKTDLKFRTRYFLVLQRFSFIFVLRNRTFQTLGIHWLKKNVRRAYPDDDACGTMDWALKDALTSKHTWKDALAGNFHQSRIEANDRACRS